MSTPVDFRHSSPATSPSRSRTLDGYEATHFLLVAAATASG